MSPLLFLHLPKTAGTTLKSVIEQAYAGRRVAFLRAPKGEIRAFSAMPEAERRGYDAVTGHLLWSERGVLPGASIITMLREPVDRVISWYHYNRTRPEADLYRMLNEQDLSLETLVVRRMLVPVGNQMVTMLRDPASRGVEQAVESAKANLGSCAEFGLTERFDESVSRYSSALNWPEVSWENRNVSEGRISVDDLDAPIREQLRRDCAADIMLYEHALRLFDERGKGRAGG